MQRLQVLQMLAHLQTTIKSLYAAGIPGPLIVWLCQPGVLPDYRCCSCCCM